MSVIIQLVIMLWFKVDYHSGVPIYEQIKERLKGAILRGELESSDSVPSVRELAKALGVNVNTVVKAYKELEIGGVLRAQPGVGYFVGNVEEIKASLLEERFHHLRQVLLELKNCGVNREEIMKVLEAVWRGEDQ